LNPGRDKRFFLLQNIQTSSVAHPNSCSVVTGALYLGVKWLGHEARHWPPLSAEVKKEYSLLPGLHSTYRDNFSFNLNFTVTETADKYVSYVVPKYT
jgi:hypothetical protein